MSKPKVSILTLTYNRAHLSSAYIPVIIDNIGDIDAEVLVWDNCSQDGTLDWLKEYEKADLRLKKVYCGDRNYGLEAINFLADEARGKYLIKVDDDIRVPQNFAQKMVEAYEEANEENIGAISWDMAWRDKTFATRSGMKLYKDPLGKCVNLKTGGSLFINFDPQQWLINGACRFTPKAKFLEVGGHPKDILYGIDYFFSKALKKKGYWGAYLSGAGLIEHIGIEDDTDYRKFKDAELRRNDAPMHH